MRMPRTARTPVPADCSSLCLGGESACSVLSGRAALRRGELHGSTRTNKPGPAFFIRAHRCCQWSIDLKRLDHGWRGRTRISRQSGVVRPRAAPGAEACLFVRRTEEPFRLRPSGRRLYGDNSPVRYIVARNGLRYGARMSRRRRMCEGWFVERPCTAAAARGSVRWARPADR